MLDLTLNKSIDPLPVDSTFAIRLKGAIGLKYLAITPATRRGRSRTARPCRSARPARRSTSTRCCRCSTRRRARGSSPRPSASATASPAAASTSTTRSARSCRWSGIWGRWRTTWPPRKRTSVGSSAGSRRSPERSSRSPTPRPSLYVNLDTTFRALASVAVPFLQDWISDTPPTFSAVIADSPTIRPFLTDTAALFSELRPGFATLPTSAPVLADAFAAGVRTLRRDRRARPAPRQPVELARELRAEPGRPTGTRSADADRLEPALAARVPHAGPVVVQLRDAVPAQHRELAVGEHDLGHGAAVRAGRDRRRPRRRSSPVAEAVHDAPDQSDRRARSAPRQPLPEHRLARPDAECAAGNEPLLGRGGARSATRPATSA